MLSCNWVTFSNNFNTEDKMIFIGLGYKKGSGKNTFAKFLTTFLRCERPGLKIKEIAFADKLKDICYQLYAWGGLQPGAYYEVNRDKKEVILPLIGKSPRDVWIEVGNKMREVDPDVWINFAVKGHNADIIIDTDVRFKNEAKKIRENSGILVNIIRPGLEQGTDLAEIDLDTWHDWDHVIDNSGSLRDLNKQAETLGRSLI